MRVVATATIKPIRHRKAYSTEEGTIKVRRSPAWEAEVTNWECNTSFTSIKPFQTKAEAVAWAVAWIGDSEEVGIMGLIRQEKWRNGWLRLYKERED